MRAVLAIAIILAIAAPIDAKAPKKRPDANGNGVGKCELPKRWIEVDALAADAGRPSKVVCR